MTSDITTLYHRVVSKARVYPQRIALVINDEPVTYAELVACASATAQSLSRAGVTPGSRVGVLTQSKKDVIAGILATFALGAIAVPLSGETPQIDELLADQDLTAIVGSQSALVRFRSVAQMALVEIAHVRADAVLRDLSGLSGNVTDTAVIIRSSGTTSSEPKYIEISYRGLTAMVAYLNRLVAIPEGGVEYLNSPAQHAFGLGRVHAVLTRGGTLVSDDGIFNPLRALSAIRKYQCSSMSGVASTFDLLLDKFAGPFSDYGESLRWLEISSMPMSLGRKRQLLDVLPGARPVMSYGLTEAMRSTFLDFREFPDKLESVGVPAPGVEAIILGTDGMPLPSDSEGEIALRGVNRANGYWRRPDLWTSRLSNGWFRTGDWGRIDKDGFVYFLGRNDDIINSGGYKISPAEVEALLTELLGGAPCAIVGKRDPILGEVPVLFVEGKLDQEFDLRRAIGTKLPGWQQPREFRFVEALPRTSNGKLLRRQLKELL